MTPRPSLLVLVILCVVFVSDSASAAEVCQAQLRDIRADRTTLRTLQHSHSRLLAKQRWLHRNKLRGRADVTRLRTIARMLPPIAGQILALIAELDSQERAYIRCVERSVELGARLTRSFHQ